jgi:hypothetical protein
LSFIQLTPHHHSRGHPNDNKSKETQDDDIAHNRFDRDNDSHSVNWKDGWAITEKAAMPTSFCSFKAIAVIEYRSVHEGALTDIDYVQDLLITIRSPGTVL